MRLRRLYSHVLTHNWLAVAIDFVIVVLGVYVAMWAGNLQAAHERRQRTEKVVAALRQDLRDSIGVEHMFDERLERAFSAFESAPQRGQAPPPVFLRISGSDTPPKSPCHGMLQTELVDELRHGEPIAELSLSIGEQLLDLDLSRDVADSVAGLLEIQVLLEAHEVAVETQRGDRFPSAFTASWVASVESLRVDGLR